MSIAAGIMISIGCICYLLIGGISGAVLFSVGLMSVVLYGMKLFTGQAGKLVPGKIRVRDLIGIWFGNLIGVCGMAFSVMMSPAADRITEGCAQIMQAREAAGFVPSLILAIPCGLLMYLAVTAPDNPMKLMYIAFCVAAFILGGFYHCVADMFYTVLGARNWHQAANVLFVTVGNVIGCNLIPILKGEWV